MRARIEWGAVLIAGSCVVSGCGLVLGIQDIEKPTSADAASSAEGGSSAEAGAGGTWCEQNGAGHLFCEDFDRGSSRFRRVELGGGAVSIAGAPASSPPSSLLAVCSSAQNTSTAAAAWEPKSILTDVSIAFDVFIEPTDKPAAIVQFAKFIFRGSGETTEIGLGFSGEVGGFGFEYDYEGELLTNFVPAFALPIGSWFHVVFAVHASSTGPATVDLDVGGTSIAKARPLDNPVRPANVEALAGIAFVDKEHPTWTVRIDNVLIDGTQ